MPADLILQNGVVHTGSAPRQLGSAVAVAGGRIAAVGGTADIAARRGPSTREIDLQGGMLLAGFSDAHSHPAMSGHGMTQCTLHLAFAEDRTGTVEVGKFADLVLLDRDLFAGGGDEITRARTLLTLSEGAVVHAADGWG